MPHLKWKGAKVALEKRIKTEIEEFEKRFPDVDVTLTITRVRNPDQVFVDIILEPKP